MDKRQALGWHQGMLAHSSSHSQRSLEELRGTQPQEGQHVLLYRQGQVCLKALAFPSITREQGQRDISNKLSLQNFRAGAL